MLLSLIRKCGSQSSKDEKKISPNRVCCKCEERIGLSCVFGHPFSPTISLCLGNLLPPPPGDYENHMREDGKTTLDLQLECNSLSLNERPVIVGQSRKKERDRGRRPTSVFFERIKQK